MKMFFLTLLLLAAPPVFANDGGMPYIEAQDLTFNKADIGSSISFRGPEATSLFNALPGMDATGYNHGFTATGQKKAVVITCKTKSFDEKKEEFVTIANGPLCTIVVTEKFVPSPDSDDSKWIYNREPQSVGGKKESKNPQKKNAP